MKRLCKCLLLGVLVGDLLLPSTVQAQWTVFDPAQYSLQIERQIEEKHRRQNSPDHGVQRQERQKCSRRMPMDGVGDLRHGLRQRYRPSRIKSRPPGFAQIAAWPQQLRPGARKISCVAAGPHGH